MKCINFISLILILLGAINWGLWGFFQFDLIAWLFGGDTSWIARIAYGVVGLAGLWSLRFLCKCKTICSVGCCKKSSKDQ